MLIPIKRVFINSGLELEVLLNTNYILRIEPVVDNDKKPKTRILCDGKSQDQLLDIIYTNESLPTIKGKLTRSRNKKQEIEEKE